MIGVRLVDGPIQYEGRIEIQHQTAGWATICDDLWNVRDARVECRMLGFSGGETAGFLWWSVPIGLDNVQCNGTELHLLLCESSDWGDTDCWHWQDVSVRCGKYCGYQKKVSKWHFFIIEVK